MCKNDGGSDGGIHLHIHNCGCGNERPLHIHLHLECEESAKTMQVRYGVFTPQPNQSAAVHVKPNGNFICVRGNFPDTFTAVRAQIYRIGDTKDHTPPYTAATGQLVNHLSHPMHPACGNCNYVFEAAFGNEVGNAKCSSGSGDSNNILRIWFLNGSTVTHEDIPFLGVCGSGTACTGSSGAVLSGPPQHIPEEIGPRVYMLDVAGEMNDRQADPSVAQCLAHRPITLMRRDATAATGMLVWESIEESEHGQWELVVIAHGGRRVATLEFVSSAKTVVRRLWVAPQWELYKKNELYPAAEAQLGLPVLLVEPSWTKGA